MRVCYIIKKGHQKSSWTLIRLLGLSVSTHNNVAGGDSQSLAEEPNGHGSKTEDTHEQSEDAEGKGRSGALDPSADEESPSETDDGTESNNHQEAVGAPSTVTLNDVVEAYGRDLHETESNHSSTELETNPGLWCRCLSGATKANRTGGGDEEGREHERNTCFRLAETMSFTLGLALDDEVRGEVGVNRTENSTNQTANVDQANRASPEVRGLCQNLWCDG